MKKYIILFSFIGIALGLFISPIIFPRPSFPVLPLSPEIFDQSNLAWGQTGNTDSKTYTSGAFNQEGAYQSYPTTAVTLPTYTTKQTPLSTPKSVEEATSGEFLNDAKKENYQTYGTLALSFLPDDFIATKVDADVDMDGINEQILGIGLLGGNHPPRYSLVVKGTTILFRVDNGQPDIIPHPTKNGFTVIWHTDKQYEKGMCCPTGEMRTRFIWKDGKFVPAWEQEIRYLQVGQN